ncbi:hypothetical protein ABZ723_34295 [Streptomyces sp. NPDC006700]|uniref:HNH endonuclease n=1 Tax=Streptomyces sp. NPDC006700 TaxID=3154479 RepID=UPI0033E1BB63
MGNVVRYGSGNDAVLRFVLHDIWGRRCYWCHRPTDFNAIQIDHLLPQQAGADRLEELKTSYNLPDDFDIHDPANLAPICIDCNGRRGKSNDEYGHPPVFLTTLNKARQRRDTVIKRVKNFGASMEITEHLLAASTANLHDERIREAFEEHAPAIVQRLALLDVKKVDFLTIWYVEIVIEDDKPLSIGVSLNARGRATAEILEDMCRISLEDVLQERADELVRQIREGVHAELEAIEAPAGPLTAGPPLTTFIRIDIDSLDYQNVGSALEFTFHGNFEANTSASLAQSSPDGGELLELQGDTLVIGTFSFVVSWHFSTDPADVGRGECLIETWEPDIHTTR